MEHFPVCPEADRWRQYADELEGVFTEERPITWWCGLLFDLDVPKSAGVKTCQRALFDAGYDVHEGAVRRMVRRRKYGPHQPKRPV